MPGIITEIKDHVDTLADNAREGIYDRSFPSPGAEKKGEEAMGDNGLCRLTAGEMVELVRAGTVSRRQLVEAHLRRIATFNGAVNAIVEERAEAALAEADAGDRDTGDRSDLPLDGVPITIKDHFDVKGMKHTEGVRAMADRVSPEDEVAVARLRAAGAIIVGKGNQPDYQIRWNTVNDLYGATRNPRDLQATAGGSSGGDAAAVAAGMAALGLGADYGGSIRVPATFCGIYGLRPSAGRVPGVATVAPFDGPPTLEYMNSIGPFARSLDDLWRAFMVLTGPDPRDPGSLAAPLAERGKSKGLRIAKMCRQTGATVTPEVEANLEATAKILAEAGYDIVEAGIPGAERAPEVWAELVGTELLHAAMPIWQDHLAASNKQHIEEMFGIYDLGSGVDAYIGAFVERRGIARQTAAWMEDHPLVLAPVAGMVAPPLDFDHFLDRARTAELFDHMRNIMWVNLLSLPGIALPNGIQIVARRFHEAQAFDAAAVVERALGPVAIADPGV